MATVAGAHAERVGRARELLATRGRKEQGRFTFEGPTLLDEAARSGVEIEELFVTEQVLEGNARVRELDRDGTPVFAVDDRTMAKISDLETPSGLVAVARMRYTPLSELLGGPLTLVLADISDPGNAGTLLRSAEAFGASGVLFGAQGVDPYHPKVVRGAMGATFRLPLATAAPEALAEAAGPGLAILGLDVRGEDLRHIELPERAAVVVGHERRGLGSWAAACTARIAIPMLQTTESLNAAVAGSIALYEFHMRRRGRA
jgi:TrmH family RNA methyltransferase